MAIRKLAPVSHAAHSNVRSSVLEPLGSIRVNFICLPHVEHGSSVVWKKVQLGGGGVIFMVATFDARRSLTTSACIEVNTALPNTVLGRRKPSCRQERSLLERRA
jgi:hypothetical protein